YSTAITDSQYFARHCVPSKYVRWCDSSSLCTHKANTLMPGRWCRRRAEDSGLSQGGALIQSLSDFILAFWFNTRNKPTRIAKAI
ncbi:hypothetical protein, partial [uncultured Dialister sp.]|uniref:hypothetical protein n=1 Tax=uncultured Dialister sp. TaxID=278064 RepID=UPI0027DBE4DC